MFEAPEFQTELSDPFGSRRSEWIFPEGEGVRAGTLLQSRQWFASGIFSLVVPVGDSTVELGLDVIAKTGHAILWAT